MSFNKIIVLGAGAIGSVYGALLSERNDVTLIGRKSHVDAVNSNGLTLYGEISKTYRLKADTEIRDIPQKTLIILTTKAHASAEAIRKIRELLRSNTVILVLQNGLGNEETVESLVGGKIKVLRGITIIAAEFFEPGKVRVWMGETTIERDEISERIAQTFNECMLKTNLSSNIKNDVWNKLIINCVVNPLTAIFSVRNCEVGAESLKKVRQKVMRECIEVGRAERVDFPSDLEKRIDEETSRYANFSSMYQDMLKGKRTEIDFLNRKIVELGAKHRIPTPINEMLVCFVRFLEEKHGISRKD